MNIPFHASQYPGRGGHYESWFVRANDPNAPRAVWVRYTQFVAADARPALGEIWAICFDDAARQVVAVKQEFPLAECHFDGKRMAVRLPVAQLEDGALRGSAEHAGNRIEWALTYEGDSAPLLILPESVYRRSLPRAKSVTSRPQLRFHGTLTVNGETVPVEGWRGSENHNWGGRHTDEYAWGQVVGFDNDPEAFFECVTARVRLGPFRSPWLTLACLRLKGRDYLFNTPVAALRAKGRYRCFEWHIDTRRGGAHLQARIEAPGERFAGLTYYNPPGGSKTCLNSKIARCQVTLSLPDTEPLILESANGAAFEVLTDRDDHGVRLAV